MRKLSTPLVISVGLGVTFHAEAHETFLPLHEHNPASHSHTLTASHDHEAFHGKETIIHASHAASRLSVAAGARYTRFSIDGSGADLWETGFGFDFAATPWLHVGGDVSYGWFDSKLGDSSGWLVPHAHIDVHIPIRDHWEILVGARIGFPGGDEALVGNHWEWEPHAELTYDRGNWFARAGVGLVFVTGDDHADHGEAEGELHGEDQHDETEHAHGESEESHGSSPDFHEIIHPHGERELNYYGAFGVRMLDQRLTVEARLAGVHVLSNDTAERNYLRAGLLGSWQFAEDLSVAAQFSMPISDAERNDMQVAVGVRVAF